MPASTLILSIAGKLECTKFKIDDGADGAAHNPRHTQRHSHIPNLRKVSHLYWPSCLLQAVKCYTSISFRLLCRIWVIIAATPLFDVYQEFQNAGGS